MPFLTDLQPILCNTAMYISIDIFCICLLEVCGLPCSKLLERKKKNVTKKGKVPWGYYNSISQTRRAVNMFVDWKGFSNGWSCICVSSFWWSWTLWEPGEHYCLAEQRHEEQLLQQHPHRPKHHRQPAHRVRHHGGVAGGLQRGVQLLPSTLLLPLLPLPRLQNLPLRQHLPDHGRWKMWKWKVGLKLFQSVLNDSWQCVDPTIIERCRCRSSNQTMQRNNS